MRISTGQFENFGEAHSLIGESAGTAYGVGNGTPNIVQNKVQTKRVTVAADYSLTTGFSDFKLITHNDGDKTAIEITAPKSGEAPQMILVPGSWKWPLEGVNIKTAYTGFAEWTGNTLYDWTNSTPAEGTVFERSIDSGSSDGDGNNQGGNSGNSGTVNPSSTKTASDFTPSGTTATIEISESASSSTVVIDYTSSSDGEVYAYSANQHVKASVNQTTKKITVTFTKNGFQDELDNENLYIRQLEGTNHQESAVKIVKLSTIEVASAELSVASSVSVEENHSVVVPTTYLGNGVLSATSSNENVATVSVAGKNITVSATENGASINGGSATITVSLSKDGSNYGAEQKTIAVTVTPMDRRADRNITAAYNPVKITSVGGTAVLSITNNDATDEPAFTYTLIDGSEYVTLDSETGTVTAKTDGTAHVKIESIATEDYKAFETTVAVTVEINYGTAVTATYDPALYCFVVNSADIVNITESTADFTVFVTADYNNGKIAIIYKTEYSNAELKKSETPISVGSNKWKVTFSLTPTELEYFTKNDYNTGIILSGGFGMQSGNNSECIYKVYVK